MNFCAVSNFFPFLFVVFEDDHLVLASSANNLFPPMSTFGGDLFLLWRGAARKVISCFLQGSNKI